MRLLGLSFREGSNSTVWNDGGDSHRKQAVLMTEGKTVQCQLATGDLKPRGMSLCSQLSFFATDELILWKYYFRRFSELILYSTIIFE